MKLSYLFTWGLVAAGALAPLHAQDAPASKLDAYVQFATGKPTHLKLEGAAGDKFVYTDETTQEKMQASAASCKLFFLVTPKDMAEAMSHYREEDWSGARKPLAACKQKYAAYAGLPGNPSVKAAQMELDCAVRMKDFPALKGLVTSFPAAKSAKGTARGQLDAAEILAGVNDSPAAAKAQLEAIDALLQNKEAAANLTAEQYGWVAYARARALASTIPAEQVSGVLAKDMVEVASNAVDSYCQSIVCSHGIPSALVVDALERAVALLYATPGVSDYVNKVHGSMSKKAWSDAPANFRDAVSMALLYKEVYAPGSKNALMDKLAPLHYNTAKDRAPKAQSKE